MTKSLFLASAALLLSVPATSIAQVSTTSDKEYEFDEIARSDRGSGTGLGIPAAQIVAKSEAEGDSIKLTLSTVSEKSEKMAISGFAVSFNAPFNKKKGIGNFLTESGLPDTASVEFAYNLSLLPNVDAVPPERPSNDELTWTRVSIIKDCQAQRNKPEDKPEECPTLDIRDAAKKYGSTEAKDVVRRYYDATDATMQRTNYLAVTVKGSVGRNTLSFRNPVTFAEDKQTHTEHSFGASLGYVPHLDRPWAFFVGGEFKRYYELPDEETRCPLAGVGASSVTCFRSAYAPPDRKTDAIIFAAARFSGPIIGKRLSAELKIAYEPAENRWGASLPIYFIKDKDGKFNGGAKIGWQSDTKDFSFGFFIGAAFDFLKL